MGKLFKILGIIIILLIVVAVAIPFFIDPNDYRDEIISSVEEKTGRKLQIDGQLGLSVFPWLGINIGKVSLANAEGFGDQPFAAVNEASIRIKLLPLLSKNVVTDKVTLDGLQLNLAKNKQGISNWSDLAGKTGQEPATQSEKSAGSGLTGLSIDGLNINNATINWRDDSTGQSYQVSNFALNSGAISPGKPVDLVMKLDVNSKQPQMTASVELDGTVAVDSVFENLSIMPLKIDISAKGDAFPAGSLNANLSSDVVVKLADLVVSLNRLSVTSGELDLTGQLTMSNLDTQPVIDGDIKLAKLNLRKWLTSQGIELPPMSNANAMSAFEAALTMKSDAATTKVTRLNVVLDETTLKGTASLAGSHVGFNLDVDQVNLDSYLPEKAESKSQQADKNTAVAGKSSAQANDAPLLPVDLLKTLDLDGTVNINKVIVSKLAAEQVNAEVVARNGNITVTKKIGRFYQGAFDAKTKLSVAGKTPQLSVNARLQNLQAGPLSADLTGKEKITGTGGFNADINSSGNSIKAIKSSLNGKLDFLFKDGAIQGVNLAKLIRETKARFDGTPLPATTEPDKTDFTELSGSATITKGILKNSDLKAKSPFLRVNGAGTVNLPAETLDYSVTTTIVSSAKGQGDESLQSLEGLNIPIKLTGSYLAPDYQVDWGKVLLSSQKAKVDEKVEEKKQELKDKLKDKLGDKLKGFF